MFAFIVTGFIKETEMNLVTDVKSFVAQNYLKYSWAHKLLKLTNILVTNREKKYNKTNSFKNQNTTTSVSFIIVTAIINIT